MKRIGLICMALVLALGALGVGYALWWDEVTIEGTVQTGSVEISINATSETYVYKNLITSEIEMSPVPLVGGNLLFVASATVEDVSVPGGAKKVKMTFTNIFPTEEPISADVVLHYTGSNDVDPAIEKYLIQEWYMWDVGTQQWVLTNIDGIQLHHCNLVELVVSLNATALQNDGKAAQGLSGNFTKTIIVHQWNEDWPD